MEVKLDTRELDRIAKQLGVKAEDVCIYVGFLIETDAKLNAVVKTGAMRASTYTATRKEDGFSNAQAEALRKNPKVQLIKHPAPAGKWYARVGPSVDYAAHVEFGTSRASAQPFLTPAVDKNGREFNNGRLWARLVK